MCQADLKTAAVCYLFLLKSTNISKAENQEEQTRRYKPTSEGMKGAIIPPTLENMEQVPSPTFLKGKRKSKKKKVSKF